MRAQKCDRCGAFYVAKCNPAIQIVKCVHSFSEEKTDLCLKCEKKLIDWLNLPDKEKLKKEAEDYYDMESTPDIQTDELIVTNQQ